MNNWKRSVSFLIVVVIVIESKLKMFLLNEKTHSHETCIIIITKLWFINNRKKNEIRVWDRYQQKWKSILSTLSSLWFVCHIHVRIKMITISYLLPNLICNNKVLLSTIKTNCKMKKHSSFKIRNCAIIITRIIF